MSAMRHSAYWILFFSLAAKLLAQTPEPVLVPEYAHYKILDPNERFHLRWNYNETDIEMEITVQTTGYIEFGISRNGGPVPDDMVMCWVVNREAYFGDYHTNDMGQPQVDEHGNWFNMSIIEHNGMTMLRVARKLNTCDKQDEVITREPMSITYAYNDFDPDLSTGLFPNNSRTTYGVVNMLLLEGDTIPNNFPPPETFTIDFRNHVYEVPAADSTLTCVVFNMSGAIPKSHMIKYEPLVDPGNKPHVYRMTLYRCNGNLDQKKQGNVFICDNKTTPLTVKSCKSLVASWAMGDKEFHFPSNVGVPMGEGTDNSQYVLEIHYSNFENRSDIRDSSGLRLSITKTPQQHDAGLLEIGNVITKGWKTFIPNGEEAFVTKSFCSPRCMSWGFSANKKPINAIGVLLQGNDIAARIRLRHFRENGASRLHELPWITESKQFSNFDQFIRLLDTPVSISHNDTLSLECTYNSTTRQSVTRGGWSRVDEVCRATIIYYPRKPFDMCLSWSSFDKLKNKYGQSIPGTQVSMPRSNLKNQSDITNLLQISDKKVMTHLRNITTWDASDKRALKKGLEKSSERVLCSSINRTPAFAIDVYMKHKVMKKFSRPTQPTCPEVIPPFIRSQRPF